jgi:hypothetical protein
MKSVQKLASLSAASREWCKRCTAGVQTMPSNSANDTDPAEHRVGRAQQSQRQEHHEHARADVHEVKTSGAREVQPHATVVERVEGPEPPHAVHQAVLPITHALREDSREQHLRQERPAHGPERRVGERADAVADERAGTEREQVTEVVGRLPRVYSTERRRSSYF